MFKKLGGAAAFVTSLFLTGCISQSEFKEMNELEKYLADIERTKITQPTTQPKNPRLLSVPEYKDKILRSLAELRNADINLSRTHLKNGFHPHEAVRLALNSVPEDYAQKHRRNLNYLEIGNLYNSPLRDITVSNRTVEETYGRKNIIYEDFSKIIIPSETTPIPVPKDLAKLLSDHSNLPTIENPKRFRKEILEQAAALGKSPEDISKMSPKAAIQLAADINARKMKYVNVDDENGEFVKKHGKYLPADRHFHIGEGDCNNQADIVQGIIYDFRKENRRLTNIHPTSGVNFGGRKNIRHEYDSIIILKEKELPHTKIDPTFYNQLGGKLDVTDFHVDKKNVTREVYKDLERYQEDYYKKLRALQKIQTQTNQPNQKAINRKQPKLPSSNHRKKQIQKNQTQNKSYNKANYQAPRKIKIPQLNKHRSNNKRNK